MQSRRYGARRLVLLIAALLAVPVRGGPVDGPLPTTDRIDALVNQLGADSYATREAAGKALGNLGEDALPAIRKAAASHSEPEIRDRVAAAILSILRNAGPSPSTGLEMVLIRPGNFRMGSAPDDNAALRGESAHFVAITEPFLIGTHEVTQNQYRAVMQAEPSGFSRRGGRKDRVEGLDTDEFPVERVSWFDAIDFCNRLSILDGHTPCYALTDVKRQGDSINDAHVTLLGGNGYRLPTEAQWEYACRAGTVGRYHYGQDNTGREANLKSFSSYASAPRFKSLDRPARVGSYPANDWGLRDMHGNIAEWCWDWYGVDTYRTSPPADPTGPDQGDHRVIRGGSWLDQDHSCRSASRNDLTPDERKDFVGFRVARMP